MHNVNSIFFQIHGTAQQGRRNFPYWSKIVPSIADNKDFWTSYRDYFMPYLSPFGAVVVFQKRLSVFSIKWVVFLILEEKIGYGKHGSSRVQPLDHFKLSLKSLISHSPCYRAPFYPRSKSTILSNYPNLRALIKT